MRNLSNQSNPLPLALIVGRKMNFEEPQKEKFIYDPKSQTTEVFHFGETGTGGKIGTKSLKSSSTGTGGKKKLPKGITGTPGFNDYTGDQKNEIDDSKSKDK
jgi:hypothetical protein